MALRADAGPSCFPESAGSDILMLPAADWHTRTQRSQQLGRQFARRGHRVFYVNPHLGREFREPYPFSPGVLLSALERNILELHIHLWREPVYHQRALSAREERTVTERILRVLEATGARPAAVVVSFPVWSGIARTVARATGAQLIYDCHDLWSGFGNVSEDIIAQESGLIRASDTVLFSAEWLRQHVEAKGGVRKSGLVRNGVDPGHFRFLRGRGRSRPVTVGYVGSLNSWLDYDAVALAAARHPEWRFRLIGRPECGEAMRLRQYPNVELAGEIPYAQLRPHLAGMDVCTVPFRLSPLTLATNPIKVYEYFACGHPVVSTRLPEVARLGDLVSLADDRHSFVNALEEAIEADGPAKRRARRRLAENETWQERCESICRAAGLTAAAPLQRACGA